jgi:exodeoxyribonuclease VII small subunit
MKDLSFEDSMKKIEEIVDELEKGDLPLEESLKRFEEAVKLASACNKKLEGAQAKVNKLIKTGEAEFKLEPFEEPEEE